MDNRKYIAIDLKSFYASVECIKRGLDPMDTNLVVADKSRTEKTICLAVTPSLKQYGISGRARLFEAEDVIRRVNNERRAKTVIVGSSYSNKALENNPSLAVDYIIASPQMAYYMEYSAKIYNIYLKYASSEDIHVYSIDEVFIDVTRYLDAYKLSAKELAMQMITDVFNTTKITATAGIGTNMYLCKVALDIVAKHISPDKNGVRIAELDDSSYRKLLWSHEPITDFWRVGVGYAKKLEEHGLYTMGDVARCSTVHEELLYDMFGVNAELLIDHAWGYEPCTIADIKAYVPENESICSGQVLSEPYTWDKARLIVREMVDLLALELVDKGLKTEQLVLTLGYDSGNVDNDDIDYDGDVSVDRYGRNIPKHGHGSISLDGYTSSTQKLTDAACRLFDRIVNKALLVRRVTVNANHLQREGYITGSGVTEQLDFFGEKAPAASEVKADNISDKERRRQEAMISIKKKFGKNAIVKGMNLEEGATTINRNKQIGGHKA